MAIRRSRRDAAHRVYSFGQFTLDFDRGALLRAGEDVKLRPKSFRVLSYLVERHGRLVTKDELLNAVWGDIVVTEASLSQCLIDIRKALGDEARQMIRTVPRRGYIFDLTVAESGGPEAASVKSPAGSGRLRPAFAAAVLALVAAAVWTGFGQRSDAPKATPARAAPRPNSIAVLPFVDMSKNQDQEYFADGISEEILNLLAQTTPLEVIARTSSFSFKDRTPDIATIADKLGVASVLEGSVRTFENRVRITAQLVDATTSAHLWSQTYDRELGDILAVQVDIAAAVARALQVALATDAMPNGPDNAEVYRDFLQAQFFFNRRAPGDIERAEDYYRRALDKDPRFARAWAGLAGVYVFREGNDQLTYEAGLTNVSEAVTRALELDPDLAEAHVRAAQYYSTIGDEKTAKDHLQQALAQKPDNPLVFAFAAGIDAIHGRWAEALARQGRAVQLDPVGFVNRINFAAYLLAARRLEEAQTEFEKAQALNPAQAAEIEVDLATILILQQRGEEALALILQWPDGLDRTRGLALVYPALGREDDGERAFRELIAAPGGGAAIRVAEVHAQRGEIDEAFARLEAVFDEMRRKGQLALSWLDQIRFSPLLTPLHADPRWDALYVEFLSAARKTAQATGSTSAGHP